MMSETDLTLMEAIPKRDEEPYESPEANLIIYHFAPYSSEILSALCGI
jgi:hypothetical protein